MKPLSRKSGASYFTSSISLIESRRNTSAPRPSIAKNAQYPIHEYHETPITRPLNRANPSPLLAPENRPTSSFFRITSTNVLLRMEIQITSMICLRFSEMKFSKSSLPLSWGCVFIFFFEPPSKTTRCGLMGEDPFRGLLAIINFLSQKMLIYPKNEKYYQVKPNLSTVGWFVVLLII